MSAPSTEQTAKQSIIIRLYSRTSSSVKVLSPVVLLVKSEKSSSGWNVRFLSNARCSKNSSTSLMLEICEFSVYVFIYCPVKFTKTNKANHDLFVGGYVFFSVFIVFFFLGAEWQRCEVGRGIIPSSSPKALRLPDARVLFLLSPIVDRQEKHRSVAWPLTWCNGRDLR